MSKRNDTRPMLILALALASALWVDAALAGVRASFDRPTVYEGDSVTLTIEADGAAPQGQPDLSALSQNFDVQGTSTGSEISIINGRRSDKVSWHVSLLPKSVGKIELPPIQVGNEQTGPLTLTVAAVPQGAQGGPGDDVYVEMELGIDGDRVMVQQQVPVVVRLYSALPIRGGDLSDPRADGVVLERLGADSQYATTRNGREYQVIERRYSLSPEHSGELRIAPVVFDGELRTPNRGRARFGPFDNDRLDRLFQDPMIDRMFGDSPLSMFDRGQPVRAQSQAITLQVGARPAGFAGKNWLPAEAVAIDDSWAAQRPELRAGEPATRTLTVTARGLAGTQIPQIEVPVPVGVRAYPEKTETQSRTDGSILYGVSTQRVTLIPTSGGHIEMPEIRVPWWDIAAKTERVATVPAMSLDVAGPVAAATTAPAPTTAAEAPTAHTATDIQAPKPADASVPAGETTPAGRRDWPTWLGGATLVVLLVLLVGRLLRGRRRRPAAAPEQRTAPGTASRSESRERAAAARESLRLACAENDAPAAARALLGWAQLLWSAQEPRVTAVNLSAMAARLEAAGEPAKALAAARIRELERRLYAPDAGPWDGEKLWLAVKNGLGDGHAPRPDQANDLAPLYPHRA